MDIKADELPNDILFEEDIENRLNFDLENEKVQNMAIVDKEYQKKFGKLYKTFDVRFIKNKIWETINDVTSNLF